jgi:hypothetical protein
LLQKVLKIGLLKPESKTKEMLFVELIIDDTLVENR